MNKGRYVDLTSKKFNRLLVKKRVGTRANQPRWECLCDCGSIVIVDSQPLKSGRTKSCGCYKKGHSGFKHGLFGSNRYSLWNGARKRSIKKGLPFSIEATDIPIIPSHCPILGIPLFQSKGVGSQGPNSPTLDRIIPSLGYVKGNIQVISQRANVIKNDASWEEVMKVATYMKELTNGKR